MFPKSARAAEKSKPREENGSTPQQFTGERRVAAWIGPSIVINGDVVSSENMTVAGRIAGNVTVKEHALVIAAGGTIRGNIVARAVVVHGEVLGSITAETRVEVAATGFVKGDITAPRMVLMEGATLHGKVGITAGPTAR